MIAALYARKSTDQAGETLYEGTPAGSHRGTTRMYFRVLPDRTLARRMIATPSAPGRDGMPDYRGYRYEVREIEVADLFQGIVWPPGTHHAAPGLEIVPFALSADVAEQTVKEWIDRDLGTNTTTGGC